MKYTGAREGYDPNKLDKARTSGAIGESPWPYKFRPIEIKGITVRSAEAKAFKKRPLHKKRKHGRSA